MDVLRYLAVLRRSWWILVAALVAGAAVGYGLASSQTPLYRASTTVFLSVQQAGTTQELVQGSTYTQSVVESYARLATQPIVLDEVLQSTGTDGSARALAASVTAEAELDTTLIVISATGEDPEAVAALTIAVADQLRVVVDELSPSDASGQESVRLTTVGAASVPQNPVSPDTRLFTLAGALLGLLVALAVVLLRELADTRVRDADDIEHVAGVATLGRVPFERSPGNGTLAVLEGGSARAEAYRQLRTNLDFVDVDGSLRSVVVTAGTAGEGKTTTAVNLANVLAAAGRRVLLVDVDLRRPAVADVLGVEGAVGLSTVLTGRVDLADAIQEWGGRGLRVLTSGEVPPNPTELLSSEAMRKLVSQVETEHDIVVFDGAPVLPVTDPAVVAKAASGGVLLVVDARRTTRARLRETVGALRSAGVHVSGAVINKAPRAHEAYYGHEERTPLRRFVDDLRREGTRRE